MRSICAEDPKYSNFWIESQNVSNVARNYRYTSDSTTPEVNVEIENLAKIKINGTQKAKTPESNVKTLNPFEFLELNQKWYKKYEKFKNFEYGHLETIVTRWTEHFN